MTTDTGLTKLPGLAFAKLEHEFAVGFEEGPRLGSEATVKIQSIRTAVQRAARVVVADFGLECFNFGTGDVGRVADDEIEAFARRQGGEAIAVAEFDVVGETVLGGILFGDHQSLGGNIKGNDARRWTLRRERDGDTAAAGAEVQSSRASRVERREKQPAGFGEEFRFGARDEDVTVDGDFQAAKGSGTDEVLERLALAAALDEFAERVQFGLGQLAFEVQVELHARELQDMRKQLLCLQAGRVHTLFGEEIGTFRDDFEDGHV